MRSYWAGIHISPEPVRIPVRTYARRRRHSVQALLWASLLAALPLVVWLVLHAGDAVLVAR